MRCCVGCGFALTCIKIQCWNLALPGYVQLQFVKFATRWHQIPTTSIDNGDSRNTTMICGIAGLAGATTIRDRGTTRHLAIAPHNPFTETGKRKGRKGLGWKGAF